MSEHTVFLVDDDASIRDALSLLISLKGLRSSVFASAEDFSNALKLFEKVNHTFWSSDAGMAGLRSARTYVLIFKPDGTFRIDDVPAGTYLLRLGLTDPVDDSRFSPGLERAYYAHLETEIVIPEAQDANDQTPFDLGTFELKPVVQPSLQSASR